MVIRKLKLVKQQFNQLNQKFVNLQLSQNDRKNPVIKGRVEFDATFADITAHCAYDIEIRIPCDFPNEPPVAFETGGRITDFHRNKNERNEPGELCLGTQAAILRKWNKLPTLLEFVNDLVVPFLFSHTVFLETGKMPYGELAHGDEGVFQYYQELFDCRNPEIIIKLLQCCFGKHIHEVENEGFCPCGSNRRFVDCHKAIIEDFRQSIPQSKIQEIVEEGEKACRYIVKKGQDAIDNGVKKFLNSRCGVHSNINPFPYLNR